MEEKKISARVKAELEKLYKLIDKMEEKERKVDFKVGNKQQAEKTDTRKSTKLHEDFIKGVQEYIDDIGKAETLIH